MNIRRSFINTFFKKGVTFAMIELADPRDCNNRKRLWKKYGFKDVSPLWANRRKVPSLNGKMVEKDGVQFLSEMEAINADWYVLSGHHGRLYTVDLFTYIGNLRDYFNKLEYAGFFNNNYHHSRWFGRWGGWNKDSATGKPTKLPAADYYDYVSDPKKSIRCLIDGGLLKPWKAKVTELNTSLYLRTTDPAAKKKLAPFDHPWGQENPLCFKRMENSRKRKCKGIILSACNTLVFKQARIFWNSYYPDAIIFGTFTTINSGIQVIKAIKRSRLTNKKFWVNPRAVLGNDRRKARELALDVAKKFPKSRRHYGLGFMYNGEIYVPKYKNSKLDIKIFRYDIDF
jgi:hypothetical protein